MTADHEDDITIRLAVAGLDPESVEPAEMEALREVITVIDALRTLVGIKAEVLLEDFGPEGNA